jgi:putative transposase
MRNIKYRLYPSKKVYSILDQSLNQSRILYNDLLAVQKLSYEIDQTFFNKYDLKRFVKEVDNGLYSQVKQDVSIRLDRSFQRFFKDKKNTGFPRFKPYQRYTSFTYPQSGFKIVENNLQLSKVGDIKIKLHRPIEEKIKTCTIKKELDKYFVVFAVENKVKTISRTDKTKIGIDLGCKDILNFSNGRKVENPKFLKKNIEKIANLQFKKDTIKDPKKKNRLSRKIGKLHHKIKNQRDDFLHKQSRKIAKDYNFICIEKLEVKKLIEKKDQYKAVRKSIVDSGWSSLVTKLAYKVEETGSKLILVNPAYTSQICSRCGKLVKKNLTDRIHKCRCGLTIDRDTNAAKNILRFGMESLVEKPRSPSL